MRYMLTDDHWDAGEAYRMGEVQLVAADPAAALDQGLAIAAKIALCAPLGISTALASAHLAIDGCEEAAFAKLDEQYGALYRTDDFIEGRQAEAENRPPHYPGRLRAGVCEHYSCPAGSEGASEFGDHGVVADVQCGEF